MFWIFNYPQTDRPVVWPKFQKHGVEWVAFSEHLILSRDIRQRRVHEV
jgi:hypothetical protein